MKLRVRDNSIRLRLTQTEVDDVQKNRRVQGRVAFGGDSHFDYVLQSASGTFDPTADISSNVLTVNVAQSAIDHWANSDEVSITASQPLDSGDQLQILIEKDFACLAPRPGEDESDMFPHPQAGEGNC